MAIVTAFVSTSVTCRPACCRDDTTPRIAALYVAIRPWVAAFAAGTMVETTSATPGAVRKIWSIRLPRRAGALPGSTLLFMSLVPMCSSTTLGWYVTSAESTRPAMSLMSRPECPSLARFAGPERCEPTSWTWLSRAAHSWNLAR